MLSHLLHRNVRVGFPLIGLILSGVALFSLAFVTLNQMGLVTADMPTAANEHLGLFLMIVLSIGAVLHIVGVFIVWPMELRRLKRTLGWVLYGLVLATLVGLFYVHFGFYRQLTTEMIVGQREYVTMLRQLRSALAVVYVGLSIPLTYILLKSSHKK